jgi:predicted RNA-binding protein with PUA-like domain
VHSIVSTGYPFSPVRYTLMPFFLAKTDPETYSIEDFIRDKRTTWDGVTNPMAAKTISTMSKGDTVFLYHSQGESAIVGLAKVDSIPLPL